MSEVSFDDLLDVAILAAVDAGELLLEDFLRPGGPRGSGDKAPADVEAERIIRERLRSATPTWRYVGEETGYAPGEDPSYIWLVDPNDGTEAYLRGWRGTAVSIGLLHRGVPVLGVVHAFSYPDNRGDLFAWADGCGPLLRNGMPIDPCHWPDRIDANAVAAVSQSADRAPREYMRALRGGRYLTVPSIAYRLALVAAGETDFAVGLSGPGAWDYAGGHALLRARGGILVDQSGAPVAYTPEGASLTRFCFAGGPDLTRDLATNSWDDVARASGSASAEARLCVPVPGETVSDGGLLARAQGCWLGQLAGDALGSMVEFEDAENLRCLYPDGVREIEGSPVWGTARGQPTDDSEMALALARALLVGGWDRDRTLEAYRRWFESDPFDCGGTVRAGLTGQPNRDSQANGALMRESPLAIWGHALPPPTLDGIVREDAALTHPNQVCLDASAAFAVAVAATVHDGLDGRGAWTRARDWARDSRACAEVRDALDRAEEARPYYGRSTAGWVLVALQNAFFQALHAATFEEGIVDTVMQGGDSDTNAAIAGALLGAMYGIDAVPDQWRLSVLTCRPQEGVAGIHRPRPQQYWPCDALVVAERLAAAVEGDAPVQTL